MYQLPKRIPYRVGWRFFIAQFFLLIILVPTWQLATGNHREWIINGIPLSVGAATLLWKVCFWVIAVMVVFGTLEIIHSILLFPAIKLTETTLIVPGGAFRFRKTIPYKTITKITELTQTRRWSKQIQLVVTSSKGRAVIFENRLPAGEYGKLKRFLSERIAGSRPLGRNPVQTTSGGNRYRSSNQVGLWVLFLGFGAAAIYQLVLAGGMEKQPVTVSIADFDKNPPAKRFVTITGGAFDMSHSVEYRLHHSSGDDHPDVSYFVPLTNPQVQEAPKIIVEVNAAEKVNAGQITGVRLMKVSGLAIPYGVEQDFEKWYGASYDDMVLVDARSGTHGHFLFGVVFGALAFVILVFILFA